MFKTSFVLIIFAIYAATSLSKELTSSKNRLMAWICLEFCEETQEEINAELQQVSDHKALFSAVSFEKYTLGPNSTLVDNNLTEVNSRILEIGVESWPLLSSYPHYPEFIDWMRTVFADPDPFISSCISAAKQYNYTGYNLDWEPTDDVQADDGANYAAFIQVFADALHKEGLKLSVDVATWSSVWNYTAIAETTSDIVISMGTYTTTDTSFTSQLEKITTSFGDRAGVGLETDSSLETTMPLEEVQWRFDQIKAKGVKEVDFWSLPIPDTWWSIIEDFVYYDSGKK